MRRSNMNPIESQAIKLEQLAEKYQSKVSRKLAKHIKDSVHSKRFYMAVLGEFNRGKSSLVNALLKQPILPCDILPTTAVTYFLEYAEKDSCEVFWNSGLSEKIDLDPSRLRNFSAEGSEYASEISHILVGVKRSFLEDGLVLIDTPGVNDLVQAREDVTDEILPNCDAALFILDANTPLTKSELEFLKSKVLVNSLKSLIFVANKMDKVDPDETDEVLTFIKEKLEAELGFTPLVLPFSTVEERFSQQGHSNDQKSYGEQLLEHIGLMKQDSDSRRIELQTEKLQTAGRMILEEIDARKKILLMNSESLERARMMSETQLQTYDLKFAYFLKNIQTVGRDTALKFLDIGLKKEIENIKWDIMDALRSGADLEKVVHRHLPVQVERKMRLFANDKGVELQSFMKQFSRHIAKEYKTHFGLQVTIDGLLDSLEMPTYRTEVRRHYDTNQFLEYAVPSGLGAVIGSIIMPGVGTIIGSTVALYFAKNQKDKENEKYLLKAEEISDDICENIYNAYMPQLLDVVDDYFSKLSTVLKEYHEEQISKLRVIYERDHHANTSLEGDHWAQMTAEEALEDLERDLKSILNMMHALDGKGGDIHV